MGESTRTVEDPSTDTAVKQRLIPLFWVVMHNDPVTTMEFVVDILINSFGFDNDRALEAMYSIHNNGLERIVLMPLERAEFKVESVHATARAQGFPLTCTLEPE